MKDYESMSDFEINKAAFLLAIKLGIVDCEDLMQKKNPNKNGIMYADGTNWYMWDGCNNPLDAWPIILGYRLSMVPAKCFLGLWQVSSSDYKITDKNPLRAAMIVFLVMYEDK